LTQEALADRLVNYADAVAAFSVVNGIAFVVTLTETEVRCSIAHLNWFVISGQITFSSIIAFGVIALRHLELKVRSSASAQAPIVESFLRGFFIARITVILVSTVATVMFAAMALSDPACAAPPP